MRDNSFDFPYLEDEVQLHIRDGIGKLIYTGKYYETAEFRVPPLGAAIVSLFDGKHEMKEIVTLVSEVFDINLQDSNNYIMRTINLYNGFITEAKGRKRNMPSWQFILNNIDSYTEQDIEEKRLDYPRDIYYSATDHCNFYCRYCYRDSKKKNDKEDYVSYERWETLLKEAGENKCRFLNIAGGDPVLRTDIDRLIDIASQNGIKSKISTKELVDIANLQKYKEAGLSIFQVSLDSSDAKTCAFLTGVKDSYERAVNTIKMAKSIGLFVIVSATITSYNVDHVADLTMLLDSLHADALNIGIYVPSCGRNDNRFVPSIEQMKKLDETIFTLRKKDLDINIIYHYSLFGQNETNINQISVERATCRACRDVITIRHDGEVCFCDALINYRGFEIGNVNNQTIGEIWNSEKMKKWITPNQEMYKSTVCGDCRLFYKCFSKRCYKRSIMLEGTPIAHDPLCPKSEINSDYLWKATE